MNQTIQYTDDTVIMAALLLGSLIAHGTMIIMVIITYRTLNRKA